VAGSLASSSERYSPFSYADNPDFNYRSFRTTNVLRWEYKIGSTFFLVYSRSQIPAVSTLGDAPATLDYHALGRRASADVILLKLSYWWAS